MKKPDVTAIIGVSGVGKTTTIKRVQSHLPLVHLQASDLLKSALGRKGQTLTSEDLRSGSISANQKILIDEFQRATADEQRPVVFDGHIVIDRAPNLAFIPPSVFKALGVKRFVFLRANPEDILQRRNDDSSRRRPLMSLQDMLHLQQLTLDRTLEAGAILGVRVFILDQDDVAGLAAVLRDLPIAPFQNGT